MNSLEMFDLPFILKNIYNNKTEIFAATVIDLFRHQSEGTLDDFLISDYEEFREFETQSTLCFPEYKAACHWILKNTTPEELQGYKNYLEFATGSWTLASNEDFSKKS